MFLKLGNRINLIKSLQRWDNTYLFNRCQFLSTSTVDRSVIDQNYIIRSVAPDVPVKKGNFVPLLLENIHKWTNKPAIECLITKRQVTYGGLRDAVARWGGFLTKMGLTKGDTVAIFSPNSLHYPIVFLGTIAIGAILTPANNLYTPNELVNQLTDSEPKMLVYHPSLEAVAKEAVKMYGRKIKLVTLGVGDPEAANIDDILQDNNIPFADPAQLSGEEIMMLPYSSGTTGKPKGTALCHNAFNACTASFFIPKFFTLQETTGDHQENFMMLLPLFHMAGIFSALFPGLYYGANLIAVPKFDPNTFIPIITSYKIGYLPLVPPMLNFLVAHPECNNKTMSHIYKVLCGAAPVPPSAASALRNKVDQPILFQEGYGMTEVLITHATPEDGEKIGWMPALPNVLTKVIDIQTGEALPPNKDGEICVNTPTCMNGYLNNPTATAATMTEDGWLHTGDVGHYDQNGYIQIVDRTKELIKVKAFQVAPSELEDLIRQHPSVQEAGVIGVPNERLGEAPKAFIVTCGKVSAEEIHQFINPKIAKHKRLVGGIVFVDSMPKTGSGKLLRRALKDL